MIKSVGRIFTVVVMLFALLFSNFGTFLFYSFSESTNRLTMLNKLENPGDKLLALTIPIDEIADKTIFSGNEDEITYKGHLYDVVKKEVAKEAITFYCENDSREEALNAMLDKDMKALFDHSSPGKTQGKRSFENIQEYVTIAEADFTGLPGCHSFLQDGYIASAYDDVYGDIFSPPPAVV